MTAALVAFVRLYLRCRFRLRVGGRSGVPVSGAYLVAANHRSWYDPVLLAAALPRLPRFLAAAELWTLPHIRWALRLATAIPVRRSGNDTAALRAALRSLAAGRPVGVFIEGGMRVGPALPGIAWLARRARVSVLPAHIAGLPAPVFSRPEVRVTFRAPLVPEPGEDDRGFAQRVLAAVGAG